MDLKDIKIGAPLIFKSSIYGDTAVHITAVYNEVVHFSIDGGESSRQARDFPDLSDGTYFSLAGRLEKRSRRATAKNLQPAVKNTIKDVPSVGKVAIITEEEAEFAATLKRGTRRQRQLSKDVETF